METLFNIIAFLPGVFFYAMLGAAFLSILGRLIFKIESGSRLIKTFLILGSFTGAILFIAYKKLLL